MLEVSSGTGEHAAYFARSLPHLDWQPTDLEDTSLASIAAWREEAGVENLRPPLRLDATAPEWPVDAADALICINMIHIAPWAACQGLMAGAARILPAGGPLILYGPFQEKGSHSAESNRRFDIDLRLRNPEWGVRHLEHVVESAAAWGFLHVETVIMPANNRSVVFRKTE